MRAGEGEDVVVYVEELGDAREGGISVLVGGGGAGGGGGGGEVGFYCVLGRFDEDGGGLVGIGGSAV